MVSALDLRGAAKDQSAADRPVPGRLSRAAPWEPHLQLRGVAAGQVLRQEGSERPHEVVEGGQCAVQAHTAPHQGQAHGQAGQPAGDSNFRATGNGQYSTLNPAGRGQPGSPAAAARGAQAGEAVARERPGWVKHCPQAEQQF